MGRLRRQLVLPRPIPARLLTLIHKATYETLATFPPGAWDQVIPSLAESREISDDGTVYTFTLADGPVFSNGGPVTAGDVVFSFNRLKNVTGNPSFLAETIASVEAPDDKTVVLAAIDLGNAAGLSFLGLGPEPSTVEWGRMVGDGIANFDQWWMVAFPGVAIFTVVIAFNFLGDGIRDALDPRLRKGV